MYIHVHRLSSASFRFLVDAGWYRKMLDNIRGGADSPGAIDISSLVEEDGKFGILKNPFRFRFIFLFLGRMYVLMKSEPRLIF